MMGPKGADLTRYGVWHLVGSLDSGHSTPVDKTQLPFLQQFEKYFRDNCTFGLWIHIDTFGFLSLFLWVGVVLFLKCILC